MDTTKGAIVTRLSHGYHIGVEKSQFDVVIRRLEMVNKIKFIKFMSEIHGTGLLETKKIIDEIEFPFTILSDVCSTDAEHTKGLLEDMGFNVEIK